MIIKEGQLHLAKPENVRRLARFLKVEEEGKTIDQVIEVLKFSLGIPSFSLFSDLV
jgi:hypothetical protein